MPHRVHRVVAHIYTPEQGLQHPELTTGRNAHEADQKWSTVGVKHDEVLQKVTFGCCI